MPAPRRFFVSNAAPPPQSARYAHAVEFGGLLHVTGQLPVDPDATEAPLPESIEAQTELVFKNLHRIVDAATYHLENTVFARIYLSDFERDYAGFNTVYHQHFKNEQSLPGRTTVGVAKLGRGALVEIDLVVAKAGDD
ncbi:reactive intermediate/imine deaminase [Pararhizobium capsulatum DSM 1112]|uniref:Reactive intermediate/imine deaminase n=1 Tax=Pararhizobium capsulatum DSM 1112 TaxID=1121113 RepID=A0ABU0BZP9_9HYPH|nr:RidA family protein [Pararhizobium capsulatum]MDQ0323151.1 reactive intermediate/imine deaminase [Pararhizobium capsulatum DSM 1112]